MKYNGTEDFNIFVDRFKKLIGNIRAIDPKQVPTDIALCGILKEVVVGETILWKKPTFC